MRVESSKANQNNKPDQPVEKSESVFRSNMTSSSQIPLSTPPTGAFEKIMKEARQQPGKDEKTSAKPESRAENSESSDIKKSGEKAVAGKGELKERDKGEGDTSESGEENESSAMLASLGVFSSGRASGETSIPAARSILHVADLERIVSTLRTIETKNSQHILIALKNSVLEGLQIKLTIDENGKLKAEFLALDEKIKEHLKARKGELSEIFKNRGVKFQEIDVRTFSENETERTPAEERKELGRK